MAGMRMTALAAGFGAALAGGPDEANAQATEIMLPHPEREIVIDVSRVAFETQAEIMEKLGVCLKEGFTFADADENGKIEDDELFDWNDERGFCAETAESNFKQTALQDRIDVADDGIKMANADQAALRDEQAALRVRADAARAEMQAITDGVIADAQQGDL